MRNRVVRVTLNLLWTGVWTSVGNDDQADKKVGGARPTLPRLSNESPVVRPSGSQQRVSGAQPRVNTGNQVRIGDASVSGTHATQLPEENLPPRTTRDRLSGAAPAV